VRGGAPAWSMPRAAAGKVMGMKYSQKKPFILASSSPRRRKMLGELGISFRIVVPSIPETIRPGEAPADYALRMARAKAEEIRRREAKESDAENGDAVILAADTIVVREGDILGKPAGPEEAADMLQSLSGASHGVISGLCVLDTENGSIREERTAVVATEVEFRAVSPEEILRYIQGGEPLDKAGAYGIQGGGAGMIRRIHGSYTNVVGLPLCEVMEILLSLDAIEPA
jgi:septum formation protein